MATIEAAPAFLARHRPEPPARTIALRRAIHQEPELGLDLPQPSELLEALARSASLCARARPPAESSPCLDTAGQVLRAAARGDMDALPMSEATDLPFSPRPRAGCTPAVMTAIARW